MLSVVFTGARAGRVVREEVMRVEPGEPATGSGRIEAGRVTSRFDVFVSYSRRDGSFARELQTFLTGRGKEVWIDWEDIPASSIWRSDIAAGIEASDNIVFVVSPDSLQSDNCARELEHAKASGKRIIPIVCRHADPASAPPGVSELNWIFARAGDDRDAALETLVRAIETDLDWVRAHTRLLVRAVEWDANRRDGSFVLRGGDLRAAEHLLAVHLADDPRPTPLQTEYVLASRRSATRRQRITLGAVLVALAISIVLGILFLFQRNAANERARIATSRELATSAVGLLGSDPELSLSLARDATETKDTNEAVRALRQSLVASHVRVVLEAPRPLEGASLSADGRAVVAVDDRGRAYLWARSPEGAWASRPAWSGKLAAVPGGPRWLDVYGRTESARRAVRRRPMVDSTGSVISPDFTRRAADGSDLAPSPSGRRGLVINCLGAYLTALPHGARTPLLANVQGVGGDCPPNDDFPIVRFSPDERLVVVAQQVAYGQPGATVKSGGDWSVRVFRTGSGRQAAELRGHDGYLDAVAFSPDGRFVATGGQDGTARIWEASTGTQVAVLRGHGTAVTGVLFTADGGRIVTTSADGTIAFWDWRPPQPQLLAGQAAGISADGDYVATALRRGEARVWRSADGALVARLHIPRGQPDQVGVADDGSLVVVSGDAFDTRTGKRLARFDPGSSLSLSADGTWALGSSTALYDLRAGKQTRWLGADWLDERGAFSPDDGLVATIGAGDIESGNASDQVRVWDVGTGRLVRRFHTGGVPWATAVAISPDKTLVAAGVEDGFVDVWSLSSGRRLMRAAANSDTVTTMSFSPGSDLLVTGGGDGTVRLWEPHTGNQVARLAAHGNTVESAAFSPDGKLVVTSGADRTVRVSDAVTGESLLVLRAPSAVAGAAFGGDGRLVVVQLQQGGVVRYACDACGSTAALLDRARDRITRPLTAGERRRYLHRA
jgi:WD40 repeat protein